MLQAEQASGIPKKRVRAKLALFPRPKSRVYYRTEARQEHRPISRRPPFLPSWAVRPRLDVDGDLGAAGYRIFSPQSEEVVEQSWIALLRSEGTNMGKADK